MGKAPAMIRHFFQAFTHPVAGPLGFALALAMCGLLVATSVSAARTETSLRARIAQLVAQDARTGAVLRAKLVACEATPPPASDPANQITHANVQARAERLAGREPQGFDVCARMESADRAVLETLR
jgi:hypothetical protein